MKLINTPTGLSNHRLLVSSYKTELPDIKPSLTMARLGSLCFDKNENNATSAGIVCFTMARHLPIDYVSLDYK